MEAPAPRVRYARSFNWFLASTFASAIGRNGYHIACAWVLIVSGQGSAAVAGFFTIISLTELVTSPLAGWLADRFDRRILYVIAETVRVVAAIVLGAVLMVTSVLWAIGLSAVLFATCDRIALTASQSMIPSISARLSLATANSMTFFLMQSGSLAAAVLVLGSSAVSFAVIKALDPPFALLAFAILGALYNLGRVAVEVMIQSAVPSTALGRAKGLLHSVGVLLGVVLFVIVSVIADDVKPSTLFLAYAVILAFGMVVLILFCRNGTNIDVERDPGR